MQIIQSALELLARGKVPSRVAAENYVFDVETRWGQEGTAIRSHLRYSQGVWTRVVETPSNKWDVWFEPGRGIYGEC